MFTSFCGSIFVFFEFFNFVVDLSVENAEKYLITKIIVSFISLWLEQLSEMGSRMEINDLADVIRQTGFAIHSYFGSGFLEKVYENALAHRLKKIGLFVIQQAPVIVSDEDGFIVGEQRVDLWVSNSELMNSDNSIIVELKAVSDITNEHFAQILHYLKATSIRNGMLINFGNPKYQPRKFRL